MIFNFLNNHTRNELINYCVFDLDGTLLDDNKMISDATLSAIKKFNNENGTCIIFASGRHYDEITKYIDLFGDIVKYVICSDGMYIYHNDKQVYMSDSISNSEVIKIINGNNLNDIVVVCANQNYIVCKKSSIIDKLKQSINKKNIKMDTRLFSKQEVLIEKLIIRNSNHDYSNLLGEYNVNHLTNGNVEILKKNVSKWSALQRIMTSEGIDNESIAYFGDDENDLECFMNLEYTFAIGNAIEEVKLNSKHVVSDNNHNGIVEGLKILERAKIDNV